MGEADDPTKQQSTVDPEALVKALDLELIQKRAAWQKARVQRRAWRTLSFLFLVLVILGLLLAWFYLGTEARQRGGGGPAAREIENGR